MPKTMPHHAVHGPQSHSQKLSVSQSPMRYAGGGVNRR